MGADASEGSPPAQESSSSSSPSSRSEPASGDTILTPSSDSTSGSHSGGSKSKMDLEAGVEGATLDKDRKEKGSEEELTSKKDESKEEEEPAKDKNTGERSGTGKADALSEETSKETTTNKKSKKGKKGANAAKSRQQDDKETMKKKQKSKSAKQSPKKKKKTTVESDFDSSSSSDSESDAPDSDTDSSSSSEDEKTKRKRKLKARAKRKALQEKKKKSKKHKKSKKVDSSDDSSDSDDESSSDDSSEPDSSADEKTRGRRPMKKTKKTKIAIESSSEAEEFAAADTLDADTETLIRLKDLGDQLNALACVVQTRQLQTQRSRPRARFVDATDPLLVAEQSASSQREKKKKKKKKGMKGRDESSKRSKSKKSGILEFKRVDQVWDSNIHSYKCQESAEGDDDEFDQYVFTVRRRFNWENKYRDTVIDVKSKVLREALQELMKDVKSVSLVEEQPCIDPNLLFLYLEEMRTYYKETLKSRIKKEKKRKQVKHLKLMRAQVKVMIRYLDEDYAETKKTLYPLIEAGNITFEYLWALFKPNSIAYTTTYGTADEPRCFKVDYAFKEHSFIKGEWYAIEGRYLEYDGKHFGLGDFEANIDSFKGPRKITSLSVYPLEYHKECDKIKEQVTERGKRFVMMQGMNYKFQKGLAFQKKKNGVAKVNINGRVMIDPAIFRRINPNYRISVIKPKDSEDLDSDDESTCSECDSSSSEDEKLEEGESKPKLVWRVYYDKDDEPHVVQVPVDENGECVKHEKLDNLPDADAKDSAKSPRVFTEEELLIASPVVYGFSFNEKLWLEFTLSGIKDIEWNDSAFDSLVLPTTQKSIVRALVSSHKFHAAETIDDVVQGKGKGLVFVLHGPPGVGKTLTGEGIAEMLRCPLYMVSAGELGTDYRTLEHELQKIMDIAHSWGAVLLLDEADVFLEKRQIHDISRNALVSIFLRILEYFQGILFLTTNRVETFDEAFQSRIHVALRYEELGHRAKKEIWKMFLDKVKVMEGAETAGFTEREYEVLARHNMNGRQIKNAVKTAQALAVNEKQKLSMQHIERVLAVAESFDRDLRGLTLDAMKSYI